MCCLKHLLTIDISPVIKASFQMFRFSRSLSQRPFSVFPSIRPLSSFLSWKPLVHTLGSEVIKLFSCSTQLSNCWHFNIYKQKNSSLGLSEPKKWWISWYFYTYEHFKFHTQLSWAWKKFYNLRACCLAGWYSHLLKSSDQSLDL